MNKEVTVKVIGLENTQGEWIGNISIDLETMEIQSHLKNGYKTTEIKPVLI